MDSTTTLIAKFVSNEKKITRNFGLEKDLERWQKDWKVFREIQV